jgi:hypothetical protein
MEAKLFFAQDKRDYSKIKKAVAVLAAGSIFGLAGCSGDAAESVDAKNAKAKSTISTSEVITSTVAPIETTESSIVPPELTIPEMPAPSVGQPENEPQSPSVINEPPVAPEVSSTEITPDTPVPPVVLPTEQAAKPEEHTDSEVLYGTECSSLSEDIRLTTYTILDTKNEVVNADGTAMAGLKDNAEYRIERSIIEHDKASRLVLTEAQDKQITQSVDRVVDATFGGDIASANDASYYDVTYVGYASDRKSGEYNVEQLDTKVDGLPAYQLIDISFCVAAINKTR